mgnify:CR=1 FL=1
MSHLRRATGVRIVLLVVLAIWVSFTGVAQAQEDGDHHLQELADFIAQPEESGVQRFRQTVGPYDIKVALVQSSLSLGTTLIAVFVVDEATGQPVPDARVLLRSKPVGGDHTRKATAHNTPGEPERYDSQITLDAPGDWQLIVEVASALGTVAVAVPTLTVAETRRISGGTFVFIGVFSVIIAGAIYLYWSTQRRRRHGGHTSRPGVDTGKKDDQSSGPVLS